MDLKTFAKRYAGYRKTVVVFRKATPAQMVSINTLKKQSSRMYANVVIDATGTFIRRNELTFEQARKIIVEYLEEAYEREREDVI